MAEQTIVFAQGIEMPPAILAQVQQMKPTGFALQMLPPSAGAEEIAAAIRDAKYLLGFPRFLPDDAYLSGDDANAWVRDRPGWSVRARHDDEEFVLDVLRRT